VHTLRFDDELEDEFRTRGERARRILVEACLANHCVQEYIADPALPEWTWASVRVGPTVRVEYEQAIAIGDLGSCLSATTSKCWGDGAWVLPLEPDDVFFLDRVTHLYREHSVYNRRFEQRRRLKELLGRHWRPLVEMAKRRTKSVFIHEITKEEPEAIHRILSLGPR
jgi:hypothetical protein